MLLALPVKIVVSIAGVWTFFAWWHVPVLIVAAYFCGSLADRLDRKVLLRFIEREFAASKTESRAAAAGPFPRRAEPLLCRACGARIFDTTPVRGFIACRCGELLHAADGSLEIVAPDEAP